MSIRGLEKLRVDSRNRTEVALTMAREIMNQRPWLPIYEDGGVDALIRAGEIAPPPPFVSPNCVSMSWGVR